MEVCPASSYNLILKKKKTMLAAANNLTLWASKFHNSLSDYEDLAGDFETEDVQKLLKAVYQQKCSSSLDSLYHTHRY